MLGLRGIIFHKDLQVKILVSHFADMKVLVEQYSDMKGLLY